VSAPWRRALWVWMLITLLAALHDFARDLWLRSLLGSSVRLVGAFTLCALIFGVAWLTVRWIDARRKWLLVGAFWVALTLAFEFALDLANSVSVARALAAYDPAAGGFGLIPLLFMFLAPLLAAKTRGLE
jgi:hypothetical protein